MHSTRFCNNFHQVHTKSSWSVLYTTFCDDMWQRLAERLLLHLHNIINMLFKVAWNAIDPSCRFLALVAVWCGHYTDIKHFNTNCIAYVFSINWICILYSIARYKFYWILNIFKDYGIFCFSFCTRKINLAQIGFFLWRLISFT